MQPIDPPRSHVRFGIAVGDITPPTGIYHRMWGAARHDRATGVHRPLRGTVVAWSKLHDPVPGSQRLLVAVDHCLLSRPELDGWVAAISAKSGLPPAHIQVVCSHTHAAGLLGQDRVTLPGGDLIPAYLASTAQRLAELAVQALAEAAPAILRYGSGQCQLATNRDLWDAAQQRFVCGFNPAGAADNHLVLAAVESESGQPLATFVNYACHPTTLAWDNTLISPDYPGALRELMEFVTGCPCVFLQGASGDLGPLRGFVGDTATADRNGRQVAYAALSVWEGLLPAQGSYEYAGAVESGAAIGTWQMAPPTAEQQARTQTWRTWDGTLPLPYRADLPPLSAVEAELQSHLAQEQAAQQQGADELSQLHRTLAERKRREIMRREAMPTGDCYPWQVSLYRLGDAVWVFVQGEPYSWLQQELRRRFPQRTLIIAALAFDWGLGYLPQRSSYGHDLYQQNIALVAPGALEMGVDAITQQIAALFQSP